MDKEKMQENRQRPMLSVGVVLALIFHVVLVCVISYGGMYISQTRAEMDLLHHKFDRLSLDHKQLKQEMRSLKQYVGTVSFDDSSAGPAGISPTATGNNTEKREVLSSGSGTNNFMAKLTNSDGERNNLQSVIDNSIAKEKVYEGAVRLDIVADLSRHGYVSIEITFLKENLMKALCDSTSRLTAANMVMLVESRKCFAIRSTCQKMSRLSASLPVYSGSNFIRWGRTSCSASSDLLYKGSMAGPDLKSSGGGSNYLCLPDDPSYDPQAHKGANYSFLSSAQYEVMQSPNIFGKKFSIFQHYVPCAVCESEQRISQLMIPAATRCPSDDWVLEYKGYLMTSASHYFDGTEIKTEHFRGSYVCVDSEAEAKPSPAVGGWVEGVTLYTVSASCSGPGALKNCPPYKGDTTALSCVVCSK